MYGQGPMQLGMLGGNNPQHAALQQARLQQEAAQRAQQQQVMQQRQQQMAQQQQAAQPAQQEMLQQTQAVRDNPAMQQMVDVARQQDQEVRARQIAQGQQGQQQMALEAAGRGPGIPAPQEAPQQQSFMQQGFAERMQNPWIQALINGGLATAEAGSRGEGPMQAFVRGGLPMGVAAFTGAQGANEQDAKDAEQQRRDDEMYELQRRALEQRIALGLPAEERRRGRMQAGMGGGYG